MGGIGDKAVSILQTDLLEFAKTKSTVAKDQQAEKDKALTGLSEALKDGVLTTEEFKAVENKLTEALKGAGKEGENLGVQVREAMFSVLGESAREMITGEKKQKDEFITSDPSGNAAKKKDTMNKVVEFRVSGEGDRLRVSTRLTAPGTDISITPKVEGGLSGVGAGTSLKLGEHVILDGMIGTDGKIKTGVQLGPLDVKATTDTKGEQVGAQVGLGPFSASVSGNKDKTEGKVTFAHSFKTIPLTTSVSTGYILPATLGDDAGALTATGPRANVSASLGTDIFKKQGIGIGVTGSHGAHESGGAESRVFGMLSIDLDAPTKKK